MTTLTIETILRGTGLGPMQSVGQMQVIPLLRSNPGEDDATFAPPTLEVGTQGYGTVLLRNVNELPTIVPPGAGWVVKQRAQDHALAGGTFLRPGEQKVVKTAMCIQQTQGGLIAQAKHALTILPAALRAKALSLRHVEDFRKLWEAIGTFNGDLGVTGGGNNLVAFLDAFRKQLDEFVAEFEIVSHQIGAIILVGGEIVGIELAPSTAYFRAVWEPLVRVCYGSLAVSVSKTRALANLGAPATRLPLLVLEKTLDGLRAALRDVRRGSRG